MSAPAGRWSGRAWRPCSPARAKGIRSRARSMKQLIETVETLRVRGIEFRSLTEALDTTTAQGRLVFHMFGALAELERNLIRERTLMHNAGYGPPYGIPYQGPRPLSVIQADHV